MKMKAAVSTLALVGVAMAALELAGCASQPLPKHAAAMPVFALEQTHPAVAKALGPVKTSLCLWSQNEGSSLNDAVNTLRGSADAKGATALIDYRYQVLDNSLPRAQPRAQQCRQYVRAEAVAVVLQDREPG